MYLLEEELDDIILEGAKNIGAGAAKGMLLGAGISSMVGATLFYLTKDETIDVFHFNGLYIAAIYNPKQNSGGCMYLQKKKNGEYKFNRIELKPKIGIKYIRNVRDIDVNASKKEMLKKTKKYVENIKSGKCVKFEGSDARPAVNAAKNNTKNMRMKALAKSSAINIAVGGVIGGANAANAEDIKNY